MAEVSNPIGRPTVMTSEVILKLEQAFAIDASVEEACSYADIGRNTFYEYLKKNPEFQDRINELREKPILKARQTIVKNLDSADVAKWYIERKKRTEFATKAEVEHSNPDGNLKTIIIQKYGGNDQTPSEAK